MLAPPRREMSGSGQVLRFAVSIDGATPLPPVEVDRDPIVIGGTADADLRLPVAAVAPTQVRLARGPAGWRAHVVAALQIGGVARAAGDVVELTLPATIAIGTIRIEVTAAAAAEPAAAGPVRTASLAREVVRAIVASANGAPELVVEAGPGAGARRALAAPPSRVVIGRGEDADWIIVDPDLSRAHVAIERTWDATTLRDLDSKNGTRVGGTVIGAEGAALEDDVVIEAGGTRLRYRDPAARFLAELARPATAAATGTATATATATATGTGTATAAATGAAAGSAPLFWIAVGVATIAAAGLIWILA